MRIGKPLEHAQAAIKALDVADPVLRITALGRQIGYFGYLCGDMLNWVRFAMLVVVLQETQFSRIRAGSLHQGPTLHSLRHRQDQPSLRSTLVHRNRLLAHLLDLQTPSPRFEGGEAPQGRPFGEGVGTTRGYASRQDSTRSRAISVDPGFSRHLLAGGNAQLPLARRWSSRTDWVSIRACSPLVALADGISICRFTSSLMGLRTQVGKVLGTK